jgi:hypothetical protein
MSRLDRSEFVFRCACLIVLALAVVAAGAGEIGFDPAQATCPAEQGAVATLSGEESGYTTRGRVATLSGEESGYTTRGKIATLSGEESGYKLVCPGI